MKANNEVAKWAAVLLGKMANELHEWNKNERKKVRAYKKKGQHEKAKATEAARITHLAEKLGEYNNSEDGAKLINYVKSANETAKRYGMDALNMISNGQRQQLDKMAAELTKTYKTA